eukprot:2310738-Rhodomonas_salina.2
MVCYAVVTRHEKTARVCVSSSNRRNQRRLEAEILREGLPPHVLTALPFMESPLVLTPLMDAKDTETLAFLQRTLASNFIFQVTMPLLYSERNTMRSTDGACFVIIFQYTRHTLDTDKVHRASRKSGVRILSRWHMPSKKCSSRLATV